MDEAFTVKTDAVIYIDRGSIVAVQDRAMAAPIGFDEVAPVDTGGTLFPGLIELHNHLSYNALPLWSPVPKLFQHRGQWPDHPDYRKLISGPMTVVGEYRDAKASRRCWPPLVRYVECKCLLGGCDDEPGYHAQQQRRSTALLPGNRAQRRTHRRSRICSRRRGASPTWTPRTRARSWPD